MERLYGVLRLKDVKRFVKKAELGKKLPGSEWYSLLMVMTPMREQSILFLEEDAFLEGVVISVLNKEIVYIKEIIV